MPAAHLEEIVATFIQERHRFENADGDVVIGDVWINGEVCKEFSVIGPADRDELIENQEYTWSGEWKKNKRFGEQFHFVGFAMKQPHSRQAIVYYLEHAGDGAGANFGKSRAAKCWELFGEQAVTAMRERPAEVAEKLTAAGRLYRFTAEQAERIAAILQRDIATESASIELATLLAGRRFRRTLPKTLLRDFGASAPKKVRENPFILLPYPGCGFKLCDAMWIDIGLPADSLIRQAYCAWNAVDSDKDGSTWVVRSVAEAAIRQSIGSADLQIDKAIEMAIFEGLLRECKTTGASGPLSDGGNISWLADSKEADAEETLATLIADAMEEPHCWPDVSLVENIDGEQPAQLALALRGTIAILCGRPGVGKTHVAANLIKLLMAVFGDSQVGIGAPTNLAAQKLSQAMLSYGVAARARTNHSLLGKPRLRGKQWLHDETNPLPFKVLVFDEESMKDARMMCSIFRARAKGTMVLLLGDIGQLPPVQRGAPLRDMIAAGIPCGNLTQIRRNSGGIVEACAAIAEGRPWGGGDNLELVQVDADADQEAAVLKSLNECRDAGFDPVWDSRVLVPKNNTRRRFNKLLQGFLNNKNPAIDGVAFRIDDKIICRANDDFKVIEASKSDDEIEFSESGSHARVSNGELGRVLEIHAGYMIVQVDCPRRVVRVPLGKISEPKESDDPKDDGKEDKTGTGCCWDLAYAVTFHSSQGSEFPWAILVVNSRDANMGYRELPYTGLSRAKVKAVAIGRKDVWDRFCRRVALDKRKTFLKERILLEQARRELASV